MFCSCPVQFGEPPNSLTCPTCLGLPGALPVLNAGAIERTIITGQLLNCTTPEVVKWDRKNYFYPDMAEELPDLAIRSASLPWRRRSALRTGLSERSPEGHRQSGKNRRAHPHPPRRGRRQVNAPFHLHDDRFQPRGHPSHGNRLRAGYRLRRGSRCLPQLSASDPRLQRRLRRRHGERSDALRREHFRSSRLN